MNFNLNKDGGRDRISKATYSPKLFRQNSSVDECPKNSSNPHKGIWAILILVGLTLIGFYFAQEKGLPVALPDNGGEVRYENSKWMSRPLAPFKVIADSKAPTIHYWVSVSDWETSEPVLSIFVVGGREAQTMLPIGEYRVKINEGTTWYGVSNIFGRKTVTNELKQSIKLIQSNSNQLIGVTLNLNSQIAQSLAGFPNSNPWTKSAPK